MIDPIAVGLTKEYIAEDDRTSEKPTKWFVGALDSFMQSKITSLHISDEEVTQGKKRSEQLQEFNFSIVKYGLRGFENFGDVKFKTEKIKAFDRDVEIVPDEIIAKIPLKIIHELAAAIWLGNKVSEELRKN